MSRMYGYVHYAKFQNPSVVPERPSEPLDPLVRALIVTAALGFVVILVLLAVAFG